MNPQREFWNQQQQALRQALLRSNDHEKAVELFLGQHAMVHSAEVSRSGLWSFEDEVWQGLTEEAARRIPRNCEHSIVWLIWHIARIEDVTMNILLSGNPQVLNQEPWLERMKISACDTGNLMSPVEVAALSAAVDIAALRAYRQAVGRRTREVVKNLQPEEMKQKIDPARVQRIRDEVAVVEAAGDVLAYWSGLNKAELLLMPPTRHNFIHLNEALRVKQKRL